MRFQLHNHSIKFRVTLGVLIIFLVSLWGLSMLTAGMLREDMQRLMGEQQFSVATQVAIGINDELTNRIAALEQVAVQIDEKLLADQVALQAMLEQRPGLRRLFNVSVLVVTRDATGLADVPLNTERIGRNYRDIDAITVALTEGKPHIGRPLVGRSTNQPLFPIAVPIFGDNGEVIGALGGAIDLSQPSFLDRISEGQYGKTGGFMLADPRHGLIVTSSVKSRIMEELKPVGLYPELDRFADGFEGSAVFIDPLGVEVLGSAKNIPVAGWYLGVRLPTAEAFAPIDDMQRRMTFVTLLVTLIAGIATWLVLRWQLAPMQQTVTSLTRMTRSDEPLQPLPATNHNEIDELIDGFNRLIATIRLRESALKQSEALFRAVTDASPLGIYTARGSNQRTTYMNPTFIRLFGYTLEDVPNVEAWWELAYPDPGYRQQVMELWQQQMAQLQQGETGDNPLESLVTCRDGNQRYIAWEFVSTDDQVWAFALDLTARRAAAELIKLKNEEMEQFVYIVSHDLKSPLVTVKSFLGMLQQDVEEGNAENITSDISFIQGAADKMEGLLAALLTLSRVGRKDNPPTTRPAKAVVEECLNTLAGSIRKHQVEVVVGDMPVTLTGDQLQLGQIWQNLVENAIKYRGEQPHPRIDLGVQQRSGDRVFFVRDNGMGIAPKDNERIFNLFSQLDPKSSGSGLGLAMIKKIVELYQGRIWVESAGKGAGSCFYFTLPSAVDEQGT